MLIFFNCRLEQKTFYSIYTLDKCYQNTHNWLIKHHRIATWKFNGILLVRTCPSGLSIKCTNMVSPFQS